MDFFSRIQKLQSRGLAKEVSQSHGNYRNLQHITFIEKKKLTQNTIQNKTTKKKR